MTPESLTVALKQEARRLGFDLVGVTPAVAPVTIDHFQQWLAEGCAGRMHYMAARQDAYRHPRHVLSDAKSILVLAVNYRTAEPAATDAGQGAVSRYAWGADYHDLLRRRLTNLEDFHRRLLPGASVRTVVDTAPLLERHFAQRAGLGWIGKNTLLVTREFGSWVFLAALLSSETLAYDRPLEENRCGSCRACIDACPTKAIVDPYRLDARRCVSYLTVELREAIPWELRTAPGNRWFGCDACQEACPHNRCTPETAEEAFRPRSGMNPVELSELFTLDESAMRERFRGTPLWRSKRRGLLRNAAVVLGNATPPGAMEALRRGLEDVEPPVRAACAWALGRYGRQTARAFLLARLPVEPDADVRREIEAALAASTDDGL